MAWLGANNRSLSAAVGVPTGLTANAVTSNSINLSWTGPVSPPATSYDVYRNGSFIANVVAPPFLDTGRAPSTTYSYQVKGVNGGSEGPGSNFASATTPSASTMIITNPGVHATVGSLGGLYSTLSSAMTDYTTQCGIVANANTFRVNGQPIVRGFNFPINLRILFPVTQGDWGNSQIISLAQQIRTMVDGLANQPTDGYDISFECNMTGNTLGNNLISAGTAKNMVPTWWYDNSFYGPTGGNPTTGGAHGGVYWDQSANGRITTLFWNANCMNEVRTVWQAGYEALETLGIHILRVEPCMEISAAPQMLSAGFTTQKLVDVLTGTTGIPNGFADDMRTGLSTAMCALRPTYPGSDVTTAAPVIAPLMAAKWSLTNYDGCNEVIPSDLTSAQANVKVGWSDMAYRGQQSVGGPVVTTNYKALGNDFHNNIVADELGHATTAVPRANIGSGRIPDWLIKTQTLGSSHLYLYFEPFNGPPCNTTGSYTNQPANYAIPQGGTAVSFTRIMPYLNFLGVNSFLNFTYPPAW